MQDNQLCDTLSCPSGFAGFGQEAVLASLIASKLSTSPPRGGKDGLSAPSGRGGHGSSCSSSSEEPISPGYHTSRGPWIVSTPEQLPRRHRAASVSPRTPQTPSDGFSLDGGPNGSGGQHEPSSRVSSKAPAGSRGTTDGIPAEYSGSMELEPSNPGIRRDSYHPAAMSDAANQPQHVDSSTVKQTSHLHGPQSSDTEACGSAASPMTGSNNTSTAPPQPHSHPRKCPPASAAIPQAGCCHASRRSYCRRDTQPSASWSQQWRDGWLVLISPSGRHLL